MSERDELRGVPDLLRFAARRFPERGVRIFDGRGRRSERRTYPEILAATRRAAGAWRHRGVEPGDRVLIALGTSWAWLDSWLGALWAGGLPVAVAPGAALGAGRAHLEKVEALVERLGSRHLVVSGSFAEEAREHGARAAADAALDPSSLADASAQVCAEPLSAPDGLAFLQLTSGSTGVPRGVRIPHSAVVANCRAMDRAVGHPLGDPIHVWARSMVSWLPLHHDMGLLGGLFLALWCGHELRLFPGGAFLARPRRWLEELGREGPTFTSAPNFGYQLCLERLARTDTEGLDLSPLRAAMTGAEMIRPETVSGFVDRFGDRGFRAEAFRPCYGLAEATLALTFDTEGRGLRTLPAPEGADQGLGAAEVACVGRPVEETEIRIVGADGATLPDGAVGEVRAAGPGIFDGYWNDPEATASCLDDGWLATGDLGFLHGGELYLTGRLKDILIVHGHNVMPHEIEWCAEAVTGGGGTLRSGAFSIASDARGERAVVAVETQERDPERLDDLAREIRKRVGRTLSLPLSDVVFVRRGRLPKTTSGKVRRRELRNRYLQGELETIGHFGA